MNKEDIQKLIGGYATGSLTDEERLKLFEAALDDQELFDTLQQEQPLKDLFEDPFSREQVRRAAAESLPRPRTSWFRRPWIWASAASVALAGVLVVALVRWDRTQQTQVVKQADVATSKQPPAAGPAPLPDREKSAAEPPAPKPQAIAGKAPAGNANPPALDRKRGLDSKDPSVGRKEGALDTRRSSSDGYARTGQAFGRTTAGTDRPAANSPELSKNREGDLRDSVNEKKNVGGGGPGGPSQVNSVTAPVNSGETLRNANESPRNVAEAPRNPAGAPRNTVELPRKDDQVAPLPPPSSQSQLQQRRQQSSGPSQITQPQQVQAPPQAQEFRVRSGAGQVPVATAAPTPPSQPKDSERLRRSASVKSEDEMMKAKTASPTKSKDAGISAPLAKKAATPKVSFYSLARRSEDGSYVGVSTDTIFQPGETIRLTIVPPVAGPLTVEESDATNRTWRQVFPGDSDKVGVPAKEPYAVPVDIVVEKNQRLRVTTGRTVSLIPVRTEGAALKGREVK